MDKKLFKLIENRIEKILSEIINIRHDLHSNPETGLETFITREKIADTLKDTKLEVWEPLIKSDLIAELKTGKPETICLRTADIDALPITENIGLGYSSLNNGKMHACGHDGHTAIFIGTAIVLNEFRDYLPVNVRFIFQPGEEIICSGKTLVKLGACNNTKSAFALHGWSGLPVGKITSRNGVLFAVGGFFKIEIKGIGCHGAMPEQGTNPIPVASKIVTQIEKLYHEVNILDGSIISVCRFDSGHAINIIPDMATINGTFCYLKMSSGNDIIQKIKEITESVCEDVNVTFKIEFENNYNLPVLNSPNGFKLVKNISETCFSPSNWVIMEKPSVE